MSDHGSSFGFNMAPPGLGLFSSDTRTMVDSGSIGDDLWGPEPISTTIPSIAPIEMSVDETTERDGFALGLSGGLNLAKWDDFEEPSLDFSISTDRSYNLPNDEIQSAALPEIAPPAYGAPSHSSYEYADSGPFAASATSVDNHDSSQAPSLLPHTSTQPPSALHMNNFAFADYFPPLPSNAMLQNLTTCSNCGDHLNLMEQIDLFYSPEEKAAFRKDLVEAIISREDLYFQVIKDTATVEAVFQAAERRGHVQAEAGPTERARTPDIVAAPTSPSSEVDMASESEEEPEGHLAEGAVPEYDEAEFTSTLYDGEKPDDDPIFAHVTQFKPSRTREQKNDSKFVKRLVQVDRPEPSEPTSQTHPSSTNASGITSNLPHAPVAEKPASDNSQAQSSSEAANSADAATSGPASDLPRTPQGIPYHFPRRKKVSYDKKKRLIDVDNKAYYNGKVLEAIERAILHYWCHLFRIWAFPESLEDNPELFEKELKILFLCVKKGFKDLGLTSVQDIIFRLTHLYGIALIVFESRANARSLVKVFAQKAIMNHMGFHAPETKKKLEDKDVTDQHGLDQMARAEYYLKRNRFVKGIGDNADPLERYTNAAFEETVEKSLYSDDKKIGRLFPEYFGESVPRPFLALVTATMKSALEEYRKVAYRNSPFSAIKYMGAYLTHITGTKAVESNKHHGAAFLKTLQKWAVSGVENAPVFFGSRKRVRLPALDLLPDEPPKKKGRKRGKA